MQNLKKVIEQFHENGIAVVEGFATDAECDAMRAEMRNIVDQTDMKVSIFNIMGPLNSSSILQGAS